MRRTVSVALFLLAAMASGAYALDVEQALALLMDKALSVHITARVTENGKQTIWNMDLSEVTISGRAVTVKLNGSNIVVVAQFTPYRETGSHVLLVAQGQTWITSPVDKEVKYATSFKSMPINLGEKVLFYPLGVNLHTTKYGNINIELEIRVVPYAKDASAKDASAKDASAKDAPKKDGSGKGESSNVGTGKDGPTQGTAGTGESGGTSAYPNSASGSLKIEKSPAKE